MADLANLYHLTEALHANDRRVVPRAVEALERAGRHRLTEVRLVAVRLRRALDRLQRA